MNDAAKKAAIYETADKKHTETVNTLVKSRKDVSDQRTVVDQAKKALEVEEQKLKDLLHVVDNNKALEQSARWNAEEAANNYKNAKAKAISKDNDLHREIEHAKHAELYHKAALKAVQEEKKKIAAAEAEKEVKVNAAQNAPLSGADKTKKEHPAVDTTTAADTTAAAAVCKNCDTLPASFTQDTPDASCADCDGWAADNRCHEADYQPFMHKYCAKSCGVGACKGQDIPAAAQPKGSAKTAAVHPL